MPRNPFDSLSPAPPVKVNHDEEVGGAFTCQYCHEVSKDAFYNAREATLYWTCVNEHDNEVKGFRLD